MDLVHYRDLVRVTTCLCGSVNICLPCVMH